MSPRTERVHFVGKGQYLGAILRIISYFRRLLPNPLKHRFALSLLNCAAHNLRLVLTGQFDEPFQGAFGLRIDAYN